METTKRASKKAIEQFEADNNLSQEKVLNFLEKLYPDVYALSDELYKVIIAAAYKQYDSISEGQLADVIKELADKKLERYSKANIRSMELNAHLNELRKKIIAAMSSGGDVMCSSFPEWTDELREYMINNITWSRCYNDDGSYSLGRSFHEQFTNYDYDYGQVPFHCYTTEDGKDVLFTRQNKQPGANNSGCLSSIVALLFISALSVALVTKMILP